MHDSDAAVLVEVECEGEAITVEKTRKGRIPLVVDGTGQIGPRLAAKMGEIARAGAKAGHTRAEH